MKRTKRRPTHGFTVEQANERGTKWEVYKTAHLKGRCVYREFVGVVFAYSAAEAQSVAALGNRRAAHAL